MVSSGLSHLNRHQLPPQRRIAREADLSEAARGAGDNLKLIGWRAFDDNFQPSSDQVREVFPPQDRVQFFEPRDALRFDRFGNLVRHLGRWRPAPRAERKDVDLREADLARDGTRRQKIGLRLAGKADDDVGRHGGQIERFLKQAAAIEKPLRAPSPPHPPQHVV